MDGAADPQTVHPTDRQADLQTVHPTDQHTDQLTHRPSTQQTEKLTHRWSNQQMDSPIDRPAVQKTVQPTDRLADQKIVQPKTLVLRELKSAHLTERQQLQRHIFFTFFYRQNQWPLPLCNEAGDVGGTRLHCFEDSLCKELSRSTNCC